MIIVVGMRYKFVPPLSVVYNFIIEGNDKIVGFDSMRSRISSLNEGFTGNLCDALVGFGSHGKQKLIRDFKCQACLKKFTSRKNTILYRLKTQSWLVEAIMGLLALGVDASALEEMFSVNEITIRTWLCRSGMQGKKLHEQFMLELNLIPVHLDELCGPT
jgi:hypothetical protein